MTKRLFNRVAGVTIAGAILMSTPVVEETIGADIISISAGAATTSCSYSQKDLDSLIAAHDAFSSKYGKNAYLCTEKMHISQIFHQTRP